MIDAEPLNTTASIFNAKSFITRDVKREIFKHIKIEVNNKGRKRSEWKGKLEKIASTESKDNFAVSD